MKIFLLAFVVCTGVARAADFSVTIDDFRLGDDPKLTALEKDERILDTLKKRGAKAALFVIGESAASPLGRSRLKEWDRAGHLIANHTYTHPSFNKKSVEEFSAEILKTDAEIKDYAHYTKLIRFPQLKEGNTRLKRDRMRTFLAEQGYRNGYVTIDASDWYVNQRLIDRLGENPSAEIGPYRDFYLKHIWERSQFYDGLAQKMGLSVKHTLLIHHNLLNALFLDDLLAMFRKQGWKLVDARESFADPIFSSLPDILPAGESLLWALAKATGKFEASLRYPGEDSVYEAPEMDKLGL